MNVLHTLLIRLFPGNNLLKSLLLVLYLVARDLCTGIVRTYSSISVAPLLLYQVSGTTFACILPTRDSGSRGKVRHYLYKLTETSRGWSTEVRIY